MSSKRWFVWNDHLAVVSGDEAFFAGLKEWERADPAAVLRDGRELEPMIVRAFYRDEFEDCGEPPITTPPITRWFWWRETVAALEPDSRAWAVVGQAWRPINAADVIADPEARVLSACSAERILAAMSAPEDCEDPNVAWGKLFIETLKRDANSAMVSAPTTAAVQLELPLD